METKKNLFSAMPVDLFDFSYEKVKTAQSRYQATKEIKYEMYLDKLDFIAVPIATYLGKISQVEKLSLATTPEENTLLSGMLIQEITPLFGITSDDERGVSQIAHYIHNEAKKMKPSGTTPYAFLELLYRGCMAWKEKCGITDLKKTVAEIRAELPHSNPRLKFSALPRFIMNGGSDESWYIEDMERVRKLIPWVQPQLFLALLAATSIRASLPSNVGKAFTALEEIFIAFRDGKDDIDFSGLKGTTYQLKLIAKGFLINRNARKIFNFYEAMNGNIDSVVVDVWITRAFDAEVAYMHNGKQMERSPTKDVYDAIEWYYQTLAKHTGGSARNICAMTWGAIRTQYGAMKNTRYFPEVKKRVHYGLLVPEGYVQFKNGHVFVGTGDPERLRDAIFEPGTFPIHDIPAVPGYGEKVHTIKALAQA